MDAAHERRITGLLEKCAAEVESLKDKQKKEYENLVSVFCILLRISLLCCAFTHILHAYCRAFVSTCRTI